MWGFSPVVTTIFSPETVDIYVLVKINNVQNCTS